MKEYFAYTTGNPAGGYQAPGSGADSDRQTRIDSLQQRIDKLSQLIAALKDRKEPGLDLDEPLKKANVKLQSLVDELSTLKTAAALADLDVKGVLAEIEKAQAQIDALNTTGKPKSDDEARYAGRFKGIASAYAVVVRNGGTMPTVFQRGAFKDACEDAQAFGRVRLLHQHDRDRVIGIPTRLWEEDTGLWVEGRFARTPLGEEVAELARIGALPEMSVGFVVKEARTERREGIGLVRVVTRADLQDVSIVSWGANPGARVTEAAGRSEPMEWQSEVAAAERALASLGAPEPKRLPAPVVHWDWIRGRSLTREEHEAQERCGRLDRLHRALARDPQLRRMDARALMDYVEATEAIR